MISQRETQLMNIDARSRSWMGKSSRLGGCTLLSSRCMMQGLPMQMDVKRSLACESISFSVGDSGSDSYKESPPDSTSQSSCFTRSEHLRGGFFVESDFL